MLTRPHAGGYLFAIETTLNSSAEELEREGATVVKQALRDVDLQSLKAEIESVYTDFGVDYRDPVGKRAWANDFRYEMFNRSSLALKAAGDRGILDVIEPLIGEDCHVIANTCWRNPPATDLNHGGGNWHIDAGPHIPLADGQAWPDDLPHPVFAVGVHLFLEDCSVACGPTAVIPGSQLSGRPPPTERVTDVDLSWQDRRPRLLTAQAGDAAFFVSDVWHRRMPPQVNDTGRFFLQIHYGRRDIAQRVKPTHKVNHLECSAHSQLESERDFTLFGLHRQGFYDG